ncbi:DUF3080 domain-containing protein [Rheinheimera sp. SM2107]|uniref:DUF3080 domain-containing protein n=2 Tax=Arsukibacterium indicum TaxID=2848612 RepID=A0ABS6MFI8_9GAMM|nr:DUF3080 domain-containing protein [Arsukibacterium indicum]
MLLILGALVSLSGCSKPDTKASLTDYQQRLTRVLQLDNVDIQAATLPPLPRPGELRQPLPDIRLDLRDAWASRECGLDQLIGERNSGLGRVFQPSMQLHYELRLLARLQQCDQQDISPELQQQISSWQHEKQQSIAVALSNMLLADDTLHRQWQVNNLRIIPGDGIGLVPASSALENLIYLTTLIKQQQWQQAAELDIEQSLAALYQHDFPAKLQGSLRYSAAWFSQFNPQLLAIAPDSLCPNGRSTEQLTILTTVFSKFFIGKVQAHLAELTRYHNELWPLITRLYQDTAIYPALQQRYQQPAAQLQQQLMLHVQWWQQLNKQCPAGLTPG